MNLLKNRKLLRQLLFQGDMLNTLNGGVAQTEFKHKEYKDRIELVAKAPGLQPEQFQVVQNGNKLCIFTLLIPFNGEVEDNNQQAVFSAPMFYREFKIPATANVREIMAEYKEGSIKITIPFYQRDLTKRRIDIRNK